MKYRTVKPKSMQGWSFTPLQLIGLTPKYTITCGECDFTFKNRIPMVDYPGIKCPNCGVINKLPVVVNNEEKC